jgi:protein-S-isoprenylcysteine O-methyltransferase Ste14
MDIYSQNDKSVPQKAFIIVSELLLLWLSYWILFQSGGNIFLHFLGKENISAPVERRAIIFVFSIVVFLRIGFMITYLLKRRIPWDESISISFAFALYYIGFSLFVLTSNRPINYADYLGVLVFATGSFINTFSELQRNFWKKKSENEGKLFTDGLFKYSMHINYFGDLLWVIGYTIVTQNVYAVAIPLFLFSFFVFYNIPKLDEHLKGKYGEQFIEYDKKTRKLIPFIY